jgi:RNA polymerase sigma factor (sigma-70 family)
MASASEFERLMERVATGSEDAVWELVETYTPYIIRSVRLTLSTRLRPKLDSQDIAQALWCSLLVGDTDFARLKSPGELIAFLARAAKNKVTSQSRRHHAIKRDVLREVSVANNETPEAGRRENPDPLFARDPTPSKIVAVRERWCQLISQASERDQRIVRMRMDRRSFQEISGEVHVSEMTARRTIERMVDQLCQ